MFAFFRFTLLPSSYFFLFIYEFFFPSPFLLFDVAAQPPLFLPYPAFPSPAPPSSFSLSLGHTIHTHPSTLRKKKRNINGSEFLKRKWSLPLHPSSHSFLFSCSPPQVCSLSFSLYSSSGLIITYC